MNDYFKQMFAMSMTALGGLVVVLGTIVSSVVLIRIAWMVVTN